MLDLFLYRHDNKERDRCLEHIHVQIFRFICKFVVIELQILFLPFNEDNPFLFSSCDKADLELVYLLGQLIRKLFLVELDEEVRECFNLLVENLHYVLAYELTHKLNLEALPERGYMSFKIKLFLVIYCR